MALEEIELVDKIEVLEHGQIQVRTATLIMRDNEEISRSHHRHVLNPGDAVSSQNERVQAIAAAVWTPDILDAWVSIQGK